MKQFLRLFLLVFLASTSFFLIACGDSGSDPAPQAGSIEGKISPANSVTSVIATDNAQKTFTATPSATGDYTVANLAAGSYKLSFTPAPGYTAPAEQTLTVKAGEVTKAADVITATSGGQATWTVDGKTTSATFILGTLQFNNLSLIANNVTAGQTVTFALDEFKGTPGTYAAGGNSFSQLMFSQNSGNTANQWAASIVSGGAGSINVTAVGANPRRFSGTFSGTLAPATSTATGNKTITGTFTNVLY